MDESQPLLSPRHRSPTGSGEHTNQPEHQQRQGTNPEARERPFNDTSSIRSQPSSQNAQSSLQRHHYGSQSQFQDSTYYSQTLDAMNTDLESGSGSSSHDDNGKIRGKYKEHDVGRGGRGSHGNDGRRRSRMKNINAIKKNPMQTALRFVTSGIFAPGSTSYDPILLLLNAQDQDERDRLTAQWRDNKLSELNFVGIVSALICGCLTSTGSWPAVLPNGLSQPWPIRTSWYCGIMLSLSSILSAADQTIRLHRISTHRDALPHIRHLLSSGRYDKEGRELPRSWQVYTWQMPVLFLAMSVVTMVVGIFVLVWTATWHETPQKWWDEHAKTAVTFTIIALFCLSGFVVEQVSLYFSEDDIEKEMPLREEEQRDSSNQSDAGLRHGSTEGLKRSVSRDADDEGTGTAEGGGRSGE